MAEHTLTKTVFNQEMDKLIDVVRKGGGGGGGTGGGGAYIRVTTQEPDFYGLTVTFKLRNSSYTVEKKFDNNGFCEANVTEVGDYDVSLTHDGITYIVPVNVTFFGVYTASLNKFSAVISVNVRGGVDTTGETVTVTATHIESGAKFTQSGTGENIDVVVSKSGDYTIQANIGNGKSSTATANIDELGNPASATVKFAKITVSINSDQGANLTLSDGVSSYNIVKGPGEYTETKYVSLGNWTLSGTVDGESVSKTISVTEYKIYEESITISKNLFVDWVKTRFPSSTASTLADLTEEQIRELMTVHASVDMLVDWLASDTDSARTILDYDLCAKWINLRDYALDMLYANESVKAVMDEVDKYGYGEWVIVEGVWQPKGNVPVMTDNDAPYGNTVEKDHYQSNVARNAFDNSDSTFWSANSINSFVGYCFTNPICVNAISVKQRLGRVSDFEVIASDDGSTWKQIYRGNLNNSDNLTKFKFSSNKYHRYWALRDITASDFMCIDTLQFYGRALNESVPVMASNTEPFGECFANSVYDNQPYVAFNTSSGDTASRYHSVLNDSDPHIGYSFPFGVVVKQFYIREKVMSGGHSISFILQASQDKHEWNNLSDIITINYDGIGYIYDVDNDIPYKHYRIKFTDTNYESSSKKYYLINKVNFYGVSYSEKEFAEGSTIKYIYDHGVELEEIVPITYGSNTEAIKRTNELYMKINGTNTSAGFYAKNKINVSNFSLVRNVSGSQIYTTRAGGDAAARYGISVGKQPWTIVDYQSLAWTDVIKSYLPQNIYLDIDTIKEEVYVNAYAGASATMTNWATITEWWLE